MFSLRKFLQEAGQGIGTVADAIVPGDQSSWHRPPAPPKPASTARPSIIQQGVNVAKNIGRGIQNTRLQGVEQLTGKDRFNLGDLYNSTIQQGVVDPALRGGQQLTNLQNGQPVNYRQLAADAATTGLNSVTLGRGKALVNAPRVVQGIAQGVKEGALLGGSQGAVDTFRNPNATPMDYAKNTFTGAAAGTVVGAAAPILGTAVRAGVNTVREAVPEVTTALVGANRGLGEGGAVNFNAPFNPDAAIREAHANVGDLQNQINMHRAAIDEARFNISNNHTLSPQQKAAAIQQAVNDHTLAAHDAQVEMGGWMDHIDQLDPSGNSRPLLQQPETGVPLDQPMSYDPQPSMQDRVAEFFANAKKPINNERGAVDMGAELGGESHPERVKRIANEQTKGAVQGGAEGMVEDQINPPVTTKLIPESARIGGKPDMSSAGLGADQAPNRFSRRLAADPRAPESLKASLNANGIHDVLHNEVPVKAARDRISASEDEALSFAKHGKTTEANATAMELLGKYLNNGEFEKADELTRAVDPRFKRTGQQMQILAAYSRLTPAGAVKYATRQLRKAADSSTNSDKAEKVAGDLSKKLKTAHAEAAEQTAKEFSSSPTKARGANKTEKKTLTPEERLAKRIKAGTAAKKENDPITDMVNTLHKVAKQVLPEAAAKVQRNPMEFIGQAVRENTEYRRVWIEAKKIVEDKYKDNPVALEELDRYFNEELTRPYAQSQLNQGVQTGLKDVDLSKLVKQHFSQVDATATKLRERLIGEAGLSESEATQLSGDITRRFNELATQRKESILAMMFKERPTPEQISKAQRVIELSNLGGFDKENLYPLIAEKYGLPHMTAEVAKKISNMAEAIQGLPEGSQERNLATADMMDYIESLKPQSKIGQAVSVWKAGLLSGTKTQGGNFVSNATFGALKRVSDPISVLADKAFSLKTGQRTKTLTGAGSLSGAKEGLSNAKLTLKTGRDIRLIGDKYEQHAEINFSNPIMQRFVGKPSNLVFRGMSAADQPFYFSALKNSMYDQAKAEGINLGLSGSKLRQYMDATVHDPTEQVVATATAEAKKAVLAHDTVLGKFVPAIKQSIDRTDILNKPQKEVVKAVVDVLAPFSKVPSAFLSRTVDYTPLGPIRTTVDQIFKKQFDQRALAQAIGEGTTGTGLIAIGMALSHNGLISGDYPKSDPKEAARWKAEHKTPNSVKVGGTWLSMNYLGPIGLLFNAGDKMVKSGENGAGAVAQALAAAGGLGQGLLGQSFLQGLSSFIDAATDPERYAEALAKSQAASLVPNWLNDVSNATDSMQRQANSIWDAIKAKIPGARQTLAPKSDTFGTDLPQPAGGPNAAFNPTKPSTDNHTPLLTELDRLAKTGKDKSVVPLNATTVGGVTLTPEQQTQRQKIVGKYLLPIWNQIIASPNYAKLDDEHKALALQSALADVNSAANRELLSKIAPAQNDKPATTNIAAILASKVDPLTYLTKASKNTASEIKTPVQAFRSSLPTAKQSKERKAITDKYPSDVITFYGLSKQEMNDYFKSNPQDAQKLYSQAKKLDAELGGEKFKNGLTVRKKGGTKGRKRSGGTRAKKFSFASHMSVPKSMQPKGALRRIVRSKSLKRKRIKA